MPLKRGQIVGYDTDRMIFKFTMMHEARIVDCEVSSAALDDLAGKKGVRPSEREAVRRLNMSQAEPAKIVLFIDGANLCASAKTLGFDIDYNGEAAQFASFPPGHRVQ